MENPLSGNFIKGYDGNKSTQFKPGHVPKNKGKKIHEWLTPEQIEKTKVGHFKKGRIPHHTLYDGAISRRYHSKDKKTYLHIRLELGKWELLQRKVWMDAHGPIPEDHIVYFKDGDTTNCNIENLYLMSKKDNMLKNSIHNLYPENVKQAILKLGHLKRVINGKK